MKTYNLQNKYENKTKYLNIKMICKLLKCDSNQIYIKVYNKEIVTSYLDLIYKDFREADNFKKYFLDNAKNNSIKIFFNYISLIAAICALLTPKDSDNTQNISMCLLVILLTFGALYTYIESKLQKKYIIKLNWIYNQFKDMEGNENV